MNLLTLLAATSASPAAAQVRQLGQGGDGLDISVARVLAALLICLAAALVLALAIRGRNRPLHLSPGSWFKGAIAGTRRIQVVEARRISPFADVCILRCDDAEYVLLCGPSGQHVLNRSPSPSPSSSDAE